MAKIVIPSNPKELLELAKKIYQKHESDGDSSLLKPLNWDEIGAKINEGLQLHEKAEELQREMEKAYENRDIIIEEVEDKIKRSRDLLKGIHRDDLKKLGDYGFEVNA